MRAGGPVGEERVEHRAWFMEYSRRKARAEDLECLDRIYTVNMKAYVENVATWSPTFFRRTFRPEEFEVLMSADKIIGMVKVVRGTREIYLAELQVESSYQGLGVGTQVLRSLVAESERSGKVLWLKVLKGNPAERLYRRLGFELMEECQTHRKLQRAPHRSRFPFRRVWRGMTRVRSDDL